MTSDDTNFIEDRVRRVYEKVFSNRVEFHLALMRIDVKRWDSLKHVEFMISLETEFAIRLDGSDATAITGMAKTLEVVRGKLA